MGIENIFTALILKLHDAKYKIIDLVAKWLVATHDTRIWRESGLKSEDTDGEQHNTKMMSLPGRLGLSVQTLATDALYLHFYTHRTMRTRHTYNS